MSWDYERELMDSAMSTIGLYRDAFFSGVSPFARPMLPALERVAGYLPQLRRDLMLLTGTTLLAPGSTLLPDATGVLRVRALGLPEAVVEVAGRTYRLSRRHSEILVALLEQPAGLTADQLEARVYPGRVNASTLRAEMTRLRTLLGPHVLASRPYRVLAETESDWRSVAALIATGRVREALQAYKGPLLPGSEAPEVVELRDVLEAQVRSAVLRSGEADLMVGWTRSRWGAGDLEMWERQAEVLPTTSPLRQVAESEVARLLGP